MARPRVFVSYSHRDKKAREQLASFLRPLEREGLLEWWVDTRLEGGDNWRRKIEETLAGATAAVLLVSQDFLASEFIARDELPPLLARAEAGELTLLPVFLSPSLADTLDLAFSDARTGERRKVKLTRFQGYGTPDRPLSSLEWSDRQRTYAQLGRRLAALTGVEAELASPQEPQPAAARVAGPAPLPARAYELTVCLERRGDALAVQYRLPGLEPLASLERPWRDLEGKVLPIAERLDTASQRALLRHLESAPSGWGPALFDLLLGPDRTWQPVLRALFGTAAGAPQPNPVRAPVRLRVCTEDGMLGGLPWRLTSWNGQLLADAGWVFTTTSVADPIADHATTAPASVLIVAPDGTDGDAAVDREHPRAVQDLLAKVWPTGREPGYVRVVKTRDQLGHALSGMRPHLLYVHGRGRVLGGRPGLLLDGSRGPDLLTLAALRDLFAEAGHRPDAVYLNADGLAEPAEAGRPAASPAQVLGEVPLVVWRRLPEWTDDATTRALAWLGRWLGQGEDPVAALHQVTRESATASPEAGTLAVHSAYRTWRTATYRTTALDRNPRLRLDRDHQKSLVRKHVEELVRSDTRRVMALVSYGESGNALGSLWEQLRHDLELALAHLAAIAWQRLQFPLGRTALRRDLEAELKLQLAADPSEPVPHLLRRHAPRAVTAGRRPLLWLDWGTFGDGTDHQPRLNYAQLGDWLRFASEFLGTHCPDDLRVVAFLAIESKAENHGRLSQAIQDHRRQPWCRKPAFRLTELPPLGKVAEADLLDFLEDRANSSCDPGIQPEIAQRVIARTGGRFEETVALLQEAEQGSWYDLLSQLRREQGAAAPADEQYF